MNLYFVLTLTLCSLSQIAQCCDKSMTQGSIKQDSNSLLPVAVAAANDDNESQKHSNPVSLTSIKTESSRSSSDSSAYAAAARNNQMPRHRAYLLDSAQYGI